MISSNEYLEIDITADGRSNDFIPLHADWVVLTELTQLWQPPDTRGGAGVAIPGASGRRAMPAWADETNYVLPIIVMGDWLHTGARATDARLGLWMNLRYLREMVCTRPDNELGTRQVRLHTPDPTVMLEGEVIVKGLKHGPGRHHVRGSLTLVVPTELQEVIGS